jgi:hypothetical protein
MLCFCTAYSCFAQQNTVASGGNATNGIASVSYSIGQIVYNSNQSGSNLIIEGLQQPYEFSKSLPVSLLFFKAQATLENTVSLKWRTSSEFNTKSFEVQRSVDGVNFDLLQTVSAAGSSTTNEDYAIIDPAPHNGHNYYRLKQIDLDGNFTYSQIELIEFNAGINTITAGPNPTSDAVIIYMQFNSNEKTRYELSDLNGRILLKEMITGSSTRINLGRFANSTYFLHVIQNEKAVKSFKIIKE